MKNQDELILIVVNPVLVAARLDLLVLLLGYCHRRSVRRRALESDVHSRAQCTGGFRADGEACLGLHSPLEAALRRGLRTVRASALVADRAGLAALEGRCARAPGRAVNQSRDALSLARARYSSGVANFIDVLDADRSLQQNELALATNTTAISTDLVAIYRALGGGWET